MLNKNHSSKRLLVLGAGDEACEGIKIAKMMGLSLVIVDGNPQAPGFAFADQSIIASTYDPEAIIHELKRLHEGGIIIAGVIAMCADVPLTAAKISKAFSLPGLSIESAELVANKLLMKERLRLQNIAIPKFKRVTAATRFTELENFLGNPFVLKPVNSRGARGVQLIDKDSKYAEAFRLAATESPTAEVMAEQYLPGPQVSTETLVVNGECFTVGFSDRNYEWLEETKPFFIENGGDAPSRLTLSQQQEITACVEKAALALGIRDGVAKGDMVYTADGAKVIEIAGRLSGGYFSTTQIPLATGVAFIEQTIKIALGETVTAADLTLKRNHGVAIRYLNPDPGKVRKVSGIESATDTEGLKLLKIFIHEGCEIPTLTNHTQRAGFAICTADTKREAINRAETALSKISVEYENND